MKTEVYEIKIHIYGLTKEKYEEYMALLLDIENAKISGYKIPVYEESDKHHCIDPLFEIKGCDMPKGSCISCGQTKI